MLFGFQVVARVKAKLGFTDSGLQRGDFVFFRFLARTGWLIPIVHFNEPRTL